MIYHVQKTYAELLGEFLPYYESALRTIYAGRNVKLEVGYPFDTMLYVIIDGYAEKKYIPVEDKDTGYRRGLDETISEINRLVGIR